MISWIFVRHAWKFHRLTDHKIRILVQNLLQTLKFSTLFPLIVCTRCPYVNGARCSSGNEGNEKRKEIGRKSGARRSQAFKERSQLSFSLSMGNCRGGGKEDRQAEPLDHDAPEWTGYSRGMKKEWEREKKRRGKK